MSHHTQHFIELCLQAQALKWGSFTLKSGRKSPYFFNAGLFTTGQHMTQLSQAYAQTIVQSGVSFDVLFGPAYKGIPLASTTAVALFDKHEQDKPYAYNRKEKKDHGEGGQLVGAELKGRVLIIDDVITAGTAIRESIDLIQAQGAEPAGVVVALDRQEKGQSDLSAIQEVEKDYGIPVFAIANLQSLIDYLTTTGNDAQLALMQAYRDQFGV